MGHQEGSAIASTRPRPRRFGRRGFRFIRTDRWQERKLSVLRLILVPEVRAKLTAWLKVYGDANGVAGLATGPIEARFNRLREHAGADEMIIWSTPERRASGAGPQIRIPALQFDLDCRFADGHIVAEDLNPAPADAREPQRERGSVGIMLTVERLELPPDDGGRPDPLAEEIEGIFDRLTGNRWRGFVAPLREALEAEARDDAERAVRLDATYERAEPRVGRRGHESPWRLTGMTASAVAALEEGEWLDLFNQNGVAIATARLVRSDIGGGALDVDVRGGDPPSPGAVRPRPRIKILAQKRAILAELESPQGNLPHVARLMTSPAAMPAPRPVFPSTWLNQSVGRNRSQARAVALALGLAEGEALLIEGPPGTGKSTTTAEMVGQILARDPMARILVCSHSNHGTDNMLMKIVPYVPGTPDETGKVPGLQPARVGMLDRVSADLRRYFVAPDEDLSDRNVIFTTIDALALNDAAGANVYDYVVLDEANRATVLDSLIALARGRRFILVGDRLQLQPVLSEAEEQLRLEPALARAGVIGKSLFVWLTERHFPDRGVVFLDEQNRMHPMIGGLIARAFYEERLRNGPHAPRRDTGVPFFGQPATWVDTRGLRGLRESRNRGPSLFNLPEARLVSTITRHLLKNAPEEMDVGVIAAYAEQAAVLRRMLRTEMRTPGRHLEIDTVDAFEGREKDVVVVSLVRSNRRREIGFLQLMQRINVALSRARRLLIVVGDTATLRGSYFDKILRYLRERGAVTPGPRVIAQLSGRLRVDRPEARPDGRGRERFRRGLEPVPGEPSLEAAAPNLETMPDEAAPESPETPRIGSRRPNRHRRSPAEILARLTENIVPSPNGASEASTDASALEPRPLEAGSNPPEAKPRRGRRAPAVVAESIVEAAAPPPPAPAASPTESAQPKSRSRRKSADVATAVGDPVSTSPAPTPAESSGPRARRKPAGAPTAVSPIPPAAAPTPVLEEPARPRARRKGAAEPAAVSEPASAAAMTPVREEPSPKPPARRRARAGQTGSPASPDQ